MADQKLSELADGTPVATDEFYFIRSDGASPPTWTGFRGALSEIATSIEVGFYVGGGVLTASEEVFSYLAKTAFDLPAGLTGSGIIAGVAATGSTVLDIKKNGSNVGTATWSAAGTVAVLAMASTDQLAVNDVLSVVGPASADATLARITGTFVGAL